MAAPQTTHCRQALRLRLGWPGEQPLAVALRQTKLTALGQCPEEAVCLSEPGSWTDISSCTNGGPSVDGDGLRVQDRLSAPLWPL